MSDAPTLKQCSVCGNSFPATSEHFHRYSRSASGLRSWCKACVAAYAKRNRKRLSEQRRKWSAENREHVREYNRAWREKQRTRWPQGDEAARALGKELCEMFDYHWGVAFSRKFWTDKAAAVLARLNAPDDESGEKGK